MDYLSEEDQYKEILSSEEIHRIKDFELRNIRAKFYQMRHQTFIDEQNIRDHEIAAVWDRIGLQEQQAIEDYKKRRGLQ